MRSFMFIGDPKKQIEEWLEGEHKVLVIAPSDEHDSTARALTTLKAAGLEHEIVKTIVLDQEFVFGEGKIDEHLKSSTSQTHYPYIYINKEFIGDHRTIAYMDYQGTLVNTVGLVFLVSQDTSTRHASSEYRKLGEGEGEEEDEEEEEEETATDRYFDRKEGQQPPKKEGQQPPADTPPPPPPALQNDKVAPESAPPGTHGTPPIVQDIPPPAPVSAGSPVVEGSEKGCLDLKEDELNSAADTEFKSVIPPTPDTVSSPSCWSFATKSRSSSRNKKVKDACKTCKRKFPETAEIDVQTEEAEVEEDNSLSKFDYIS